MGGEVGWCAAEELAAAAIGVGLVGRGCGGWAGIRGGAALVVGEEG